VGDGAAHVRAAEDDQAQGFVYDVGKHGAQSQKGQAHVAKKAGGSKGKAHMGKEKHWEENCFPGYIIILRDCSLKYRQMTDRDCSGVTHLTVRAVDDGNFWNFKLKLFIYNTNRNLFNVSWSGPHEY
jgi:hypothetical protein